jgi:uncharacterized protein (DUF1697 family)
MALVTFLRGVNVGGHRTFRPSVLANQMKNYGVVNVGAAGTFVVCRRVSQTRFRSELLRRLPFEPEIMMCTPRELITAATHNPFDGEPPRSDITRFVSVLAKSPKLLPSIPVRIPEHGKWLLRILTRHDRFLFGVYRREMKAIACLGAIDKLFGAPATTRNWNTIQAILRVLENGCDKQHRK